MADSENSDSNAKDGLDFMDPLGAKNPLGNSFDIGDNGVEFDVSF